MSNRVPAGWSMLEMSEIITQFQNGNAFSAKGYAPEGIPIVSMGSIQLDGIFKKDNKKIKYWNSADREKLLRYIVKPQDLIMAMTDVTPTMELIGRACIVNADREYLLNQRVGLIKVNEERVSKYFLAYLSNYDDWRSYCMGASGLGAQANLGTAQILDGVVLLPPLPEQQKIATILSSVDDVIEKTRVQIDKLKELKTGMMQELFTKGIVQTESNDSSGVWSVKPIGDLVKKVGSGITPSGGSASYVDVGIPFIRSQNVHSDGLRLDNVSYITEDQHQKMAGSQLMPNDVLLNITGASIGRCYYLPADFIEGNVNQHVCIIRVKKAVVNPMFLTLFLNSEFGQGQIMSLQAGGNREGLNFQQIRSIKLPLPSIKEQEEIVGITFSIEENIRYKSKKLSSLVNTKKALMQDLLTGKVRVNLTDKESAAS